MFQATVDIPPDTATRIGWSQLYGEKVIYLCTVEPLVTNGHL